LSAFFIHCTAEHAYRQRTIPMYAVRCLLVHGQVTIIFVVYVCLSVCAECFSAVFDPIWIKLGHMLHIRF